jgi:septum formation protein
MSKRLVLASQSPRRKEILTFAGLPFEVRVPGVDEVRLPEESPEVYVQRLAREKARAVSIDADEIVLAADTTVVFHQHVLEKPRDTADAIRMLSLLQGAEHQVMTGICLRTQDRELVDLAVTRVWFNPLSQSDIATYAASGEPNDKAGAYAIQGLASKFIERIEGCYFNVVGLPVALVYRRLKQIGYEP